MKRMIQVQRWPHYAFYIIFGISGLFLVMYYLSNTLIYFTTPQQFPINSFERFPLTWLIFPAEMFSFLFGFYFIYTLLTDRHRSKPQGKLTGSPAVAILLPVYNEPKEIVERTISACRKLKWRGAIRTYLLDDSTNDDDKRNMSQLARKHGCTIVRRDEREGYKAGNINNAVAKAVKEDYFVIFDADQAPEPEFLEETMDYFSDPKVAFVQTPQYFINEDTPIERTSKIGANIFFQGMCVSRARDGAMVFCGTNAVIRASAFREVEGFSYFTATEDLELGLRLNDKGYHGEFVPQVLVYGYAPTNFKAYASQQYRWSNGNLAILREYWARILAGNFSLKHQIHTLFVLGWWLIGIVTLVYILVPIISLVTGWGTHHTWLPTVLLGWLYFHVVLGVGMIYVSLQNRVEGDKITLRDAFLQYSLLTNSMFIYTRAAVNALFKRYIGFVRTNKKKERTGLSLIRWNLLLATLTFVASIVTLIFAARSSDMQQLRTYLPISLWLLFYTIVLASAIFFIGDAATESETA